MRKMFSRFLDKYFLKLMFNCFFRNMNIYLCIIYKRNDIIVENIVLFFENEVNLIC